MADVLAIHDFLSDSNPHAARALALSLLEIGNSLSHSPLRGRPGDQMGTRELLAASPYIVTYQIKDDQVTILRIRDGRRR